MPSSSPSSPPPRYKTPPLVPLSTHPPWSQLLPLPRFTLPFSILGKLSPPMAGIRTSKSRNGSKASRAYPHPRIWWAAIIASVTLNLVLLSLLLPLYNSPQGAPVPPQSSKMAPSMEKKESSSADENQVEVSATSGSKPVSKDSVINLEIGDPTVFEAFWRMVGEEGTVTIPGWQTISYFSDPTNVCWFLEPELNKEIRRLHQLVGNAAVEDRHIVIGTGSMQLMQAALFALSPADAPEPMNVVSPLPYYSSYPAITDYLKSGLYRWAGDAYAFKGEAFIELVCSPSNPDGFIRQAVLSSEKGKAIHDLAYYWPHYTPITGPVDEEIMLFTVSKCTGHAGSRLGWALVRNRDVAKRMTKFLELNTIGASKDSQLRAAKLLKVVSDGYELPEPVTARLFEFGRSRMSRRWDSLREIVRKTGLFSLPEFPSATCKFTGVNTTSYPAFAWLKCERGDIDDCESFLKTFKILTRSGRHFGVDPKYVRVSMLERDETFELFIERLMSIE